ncbi:hypothetical protein AC249_AIPGENE28224 [Exaiptasia diaphana]|nr:hypothetical protein AC249_AIPGENE28224 [Exaiptasia diaphana]
MTSSEDLSKGNTSKPSNTDDEDVGIPNLGFQPYPEEHKSDNTSGNKRADEPSGLGKYNYKPFLPCAPSIAA